MALHNTARESDQIEEENVDLNNEISSGQFSSAVLRLAGVLHPSVSLSIGTRKLLHELMTHARVDLNGHFQSQLSHGTVHHLWDQNSAELNEIFQHYCTRDDSKAKKSNTDSPKISKKLKLNKAVGVDEVPGEFWRVIFDDFNYLVSVWVLEFVNSLWR